MAGKSTVAIRVATRCAGRLIGQNKCELSQLKVTGTAKEMTTDYAVCSVLSAQCLDGRRLRQLCSFAEREVGGFAPEHEAAKRTAKQLPAG